MTKRIVTVKSETTVKRAESLKTQKKASCLVVVRGDAAIGIVTERDLVRKVIGAGVDPSRPDKRHHVDPRPHHRESSHVTRVRN